MAVLAMIFDLFAALGFTLTTVDRGLLSVQLTCCVMIGSLIVLAWLVAYSSHMRHVQDFGLTPRAAFAALLLDLRACVAGLSHWGLVPDGQALCLPLESVSCPRTIVCPHLLCPASG